MANLPLLDELIDLNRIESINSNKIHNFLNKHDKIKIRTGKILSIFSEYFGERTKLKRLKLNKCRAKICSKN